jgi:hypothetical protein
MSIRWITRYANHCRRYGIHQVIHRKGEIMKKALIASLAALLATTIALAYEIHHPNLRDAYGATDNAIHHIQEAQAANRGLEFGGHADKALEALQRAEREIVAADRWNDAHHR